MMNEGYAQRYHTGRQPARALTREKIAEMRSSGGMENYYLNERHAGQQNERDRIYQPADNDDGSVQLPGRRRRRKGKLLRKIVTLLIVLLIIGGAVFLFASGDLNTDLSDQNVLNEYGISAEAAALASEHRIINIAVFGIDGREGVSGDRTDAMLVCSVNFEKGTIMVSSVMRDTYAWIDSEQCYDKINAAYAYCGAKGAVRAINENFDTAVTDYVTVDFQSMVEVVDACGGVEVTIEDPDVLYWTNIYIDDVNNTCGKNAAYLTDLGAQTINGSQALAYCRVRYTGNGDFDRAARQREVLKQAMTKAMNLNKIEMLRLLKKVWVDVETSLTIKEMAQDLINILMMTNKKITQLQLPYGNYCLADYYNDVSYVFPHSLEKSIKSWYEDVYCEYGYELSPKALEISEYIDGISD